MKKKILIAALLTTLILSVLFVPIPGDSYDDGGTKEYSALTYKIVKWNRITADGIYENTCIYWGNDAKLSIDRLWQTECENVPHRFLATVIEIDGANVLLEPLSGEDELQSSDRFTVNTQALTNLDISVDTVVEITYCGEIMESYPAQIQATDWRIINDLQDVAYTGHWLDKELSEKQRNNLFTDIVITRIYSDCFFARCVVPMPYEIKMNGTISEKWCVGDQVAVTYENTYYDTNNYRVEADLLTIQTSTFQIDPMVCYKPVIYLYPEQETDVHVSLMLDGELTCTYPRYRNGWDVTALPDGTLMDTSGLVYNYLYWEGETKAAWDMSEGFCVRGEDTALFLENALSKLGLTRKEANEFIVYWLPLMEQNPYNVISFQTDIYMQAAQLEVSPAPDTIIRVFMVWQASDMYIPIAEQPLVTPQRQGFTLVEWGGTQIP